MKLGWLVWGVLVAVVAVAPQAHADGAGLQTLELGAGPTVVLVPGLGGSRTDWLPTVKRLKDHYHCVMVEIPGQGTSPLPDPFSLQAAANALDAVIAKQKPDSTIVIGDGVGGILALVSASAHPEHQRAVMLIDTPIKSPMPIPDQERDDMVRFIDEHFDQFAQMAFAKMGRDSTESARLYAMIAAVPPATVKAYVREMLRMDGNHDLHNVKGPLALTFSEHAWKAGTTWGGLAKNFGYEDTTLAAPVRIVNSGPMVMKDQPDTLAALIGAFAQRGYAGRK